MNGKEFREKNNVRQCERCCGNCAHGRDLCSDGASECIHPDIDDAFPTRGSIITSLDDVCNAWEAEP